MEKIEAFKFFNKEYSVDKYSEMYKKLRFDIRYPANIKKGEKFNNQNIRRIRPGYGLEPKYYEKLIGRKSPITFDKGQPLKKFILYKLKINK